MFCDRSIVIRPGASAVVMTAMLCLTTYLGCSPEYSGGAANVALVENREPFSMETRDGHTIYGHLHRPTSAVTGTSTGVGMGMVRTPDSTFTLILAFHQGGSSGEAEYAPIIPRLLEEGFGVLTIDQRRGGDRFMGQNRVSSNFDQETVGYCDVIEDLEAAFSYALGVEDVDEIIAWGSSYSASLAVMLGASHPELISRVLAFSPASGESMAGCNPLSSAFDLRQPALFLRPKSEMSFGSVAADMDAYINMGHQIFVASPGAHGSSMLVDSRAEGDTEKTWNAVLEFLHDRL